MDIGQTVVNAIEKQLKIKYLVWRSRFATKGYIYLFSGCKLPFITCEEGTLLTLGDNWQLSVPNPFDAIVVELWQKARTSCDLRSWWKGVSVTTTPARDTSSLRIRVEVYDATVTLFINENHRYDQQIFWLLCGPGCKFCDKDTFIRKCEVSWATEI